MNISFFDDLGGLLGGGVTSANSNPTSEKKILILVGSGVQQPEPKCLLDLKSNFFIPEGGGRLANSSVTSGKK